MKSQPRLLNVNRVPSQPKKRKKITLVFDEKKRRDFLRGFRKRKLERKQKAKEELDKRLKEERKRIKQDARERLAKLVSHRDIPELEQLLSQQEFETEGHTVSILELNVADLVEKNTLIGENKGMNENTEEDKADNDEVSNASNSDIEGMSLQQEHTRPAIKSNQKDSIIKTKKDLQRVITKQVKKTKAFQKQQRIIRIKNKKEHKRKVRLLEKRKEKSKKRNH